MSTDVSGTSLNSALYVLSASCGTQLVCDNSPSAFDSTASVELEAGETVTIVVDGTNGTSGTYDLTIVGP